jgi:oligosaccharide repeat unit polymerase
MIVINNHYCIWRRLLFMEIYLNLIPVTFLVFVTLVVRTQQKSWLSPGAFIMLITSIYMIAPLLFTPNYMVWHGSLWWIVLSTITFYIGSAIGMRFKTKKKNNTLSMEFIKSVPFKGLKKWTFLFSLIGIAGLLYFLNRLGLSLNVFVSFNSLGDVSSSISHSRYTGEYSQPTLYNIALAFNYSAGFLGGMLWIFNRTRIAFFPFIPIILTTALTTTKSVIIFITLFWIGGFLTAKVLTKQFKVFTPKLLLNYSLIGALLNGLFIIYFMLRYNWLDVKYLGAIYGKLVHYYFGYLPAFSEWFRNYGYGWNELLWGQMTFAGVWDVLGVDRVQGMYDNFIIIDPIKGNSTNIYTIYRFFIDDFGLFGSILVFLLIGLIVGYAYKQVLNGRILFMPILMLFYAQTLFSNTTSILSYNSLLLAWSLLSCYLIYVSIPNFKRIEIYKKELKQTSIRGGSF